MFISPSTVADAKKLGTRQLAHSALPGEPYTAIDAVVDLLAESTSPAAQRGARILLSQMGTLPWEVIRGAHRSSDDPSLHITIAIAATRYHLRLDARSCVFDITHVVGNKTHRLAGPKPWVGPGA